MKLLRFFLISVLIVCVNIHAQERPPIQVYEQNEYGGESQNWSISQSKERYVYVANNKGLLEYNGGKWSLYESPNSTIIRAVKVINDLIYTGSYQEFGYWKRDDYGVLNYTSLLNELNVSFVEDEEFWSVLHYDDWVLFQSLDRIHLYNTTTKVYSTINSILSVSKMFKVGENVFFQDINNGLYKIENGSAVLISDVSIVKHSVIINMFSIEDAILILTQDDGFFKLENGVLNPWVIGASKAVNDVSVFSCIQLKDKSFVLGTISDGVIHLESNGNFRYKIDQTNGLSNNTVLSLFEDIDSNIWLGLDNGINCINAQSPYRIYADKKGKIGSVYVSTIYKEKLYLGTNQGLFYKPINKDEEFKFIEGTQGQVWFIENIDNTLFCGHNSGTFEIKNNKATKIATAPGTWQIKKIENKPNLLIQGNYNGLNILEKVNSKWQFRNKIEGFNMSSRYFEFLNEKEIFVSHEYKGIFKLNVDKEFTKINKFTKDSILGKDLYSSIVKFKNDILYTNNDGVFKYNDNRNAFEKDSLLSLLISKDNFFSGRLEPDFETNKLWSFSKKGFNYLTSSKISGEAKVNSISFPVDLRKGVIGFENITHIKDDEFIFGTTTGYITINLNKSNNHEHEIKINQIQVSKLKENDSVQLVCLSSKAEFENKENNLFISYSISEFLKAQKPEYQYKLDGLYDSWSDWTSNANITFENLPYGNYTFNVRGRVGSKMTLNTASFTFNIDRPWFLSNMAIGAYVLCVLLFSIFMHNIYKRYYKKQQERLMQKTTREFELKELENKQQLMRYRNEKLREDIDNKNRELGISTMNLIKKNEFLSTIKKELENVDNNTRSLNQVIKIIDKNLNNTDDWNLFQEAFNNADKDFLKKIKTMHPALTANDLRLCAYLRLNLSSKEIAPLLNISSRSVEVKRYRLRKKMDLQHESSLSDYILEI